MKISPGNKLSEAFSGVLVGTAVGDALGLPAEGMSRSRIQRRWCGVWRHRFLFGYGMVSDDTEHTLFVAQALLTHPDDVLAFQRCLAGKLRLWLLGLPAGIGLATLKAILRLWLGFSPNRSGVCSAGNGPAMRSAIIGAYFADDPDQRRAFVSAATRLTHTDPKAETAARAVAETAAWAANQSVSTRECLPILIQFSHDKEWLDICRRLTTALDSGKSVTEFADALGLQNGVTGYAYHSIPISLYACLRHPGNFRAALEAALNCGGDTDTVGAIIGAIMGARVGTAGIPQEWLQGICDQPRSIRMLTLVAERLTEQKAAKRALGPVTYMWPLLVIRNIAFLVTVLLHGLRRLAPPF